jgi:glucose-1-phosphate adenylyltransferase
MRDVLTLILAGGKGTRLEPLTRDRAKPAVPFGGLYRIIDFTLSNCVNSGLRRVLVLTQFKAGSLNKHINLGWGFLSTQLGESIDVLPPQQRIDESWYRGTADAIYQNIYTIERENPALVMILAGDHIYKMNYADMIQEHLQNEADLTIGCIPAPLSESRHFGVIQSNADGTVAGFVEKPPKTAPMPGDSQHFLASMGIYVFNARKMYNLLIEDAARPESSHDFGRNIIPAMIGSYRVFAHRFRDLNRKLVPYWRDVGTLDAYYQANMDLVAVDPVLNLYDDHWPIRTYQPHLPPPKFVHYVEGKVGDVQRGEGHESMVCPGSIISGGRVWRCIVAPRVRVNSYASVEESILLDRVDVGRHCRIRRAIIDKDIVIPKNATIGFDPEQDRRRGFTITEQGIVVVPKGTPPDAFSR